MNTMRKATLPATGEDVCADAFLCSARIADNFSGI